MSWSRDRTAGSAANCMTLTEARASMHAAGLEQGRLILPQSGISGSDAKAPARVQLRTPPASAKGITSAAESTTHSAGTHM